MLVRYRVARRVTGAVLVIVGGALMWFAPETPAGILLLAAGILLEIVGISLEHGRGKST